MSERLIAALRNVKNLEKINLGAIVDHIESEALLILCLVAILPFMQPIPIPGLSSILGLIVFLQGLGLFLWNRPLLTKRLRSIVIPRDKFESIEKAAIKFNVYASKLSTFKHPIINTRPGHMLSGLSIMLSSAFLALPLPIPFSNFIPALSIFLICLGLLEEDIILTLLGHFITITIFWMGIFSFHLIREQIQNWI